LLRKISFCIVLPLVNLQVLGSLYMGTKEEGTSSQPLSVQIKL
jgi:hypothetical protein